MRWFRLICCGLAVTTSLLYAQNTPKVDAPHGNAPKVNEDSLVGKNFTDRVSAYVNLRKNAQSKVNPQKPTNSADTLDSRDKSLTQELKAARQGAKQGEIFTPEAIALFRKLMATSFNSSDGAKVRASLRHAEPVSKFALKINEDYPSTSSGAVHASLGAHEPSAIAERGRISHCRTRSQYCWMSAPIWLSTLLRTSCHRVKRDFETARTGSNFK